MWEVVRRGLGAPARAEDAAESAQAMELDEPAPAPNAGDASDAESSDGEDDGEEAPVASTSAQPLAAAAAGPKLHTTLPASFRTTPQTRRLLGNAFAYLVRKAKPASSGEAETAGSLDDLMRRIVEDVAAVEAVDGGMRANGGKSAKGRRKGKGKGRGQEEGSSNIFAEGVTWVVTESCSVRSRSSDSIHCHSPD